MPSPPTAQKLKGLSAVSMVLRFGVSLVLVVSGVFGGGVAAALPGNSPDLVPGLPVYLALGDSIANGQQSADVVPDDYWATVDAWQANGYVAQFSEDLESTLNCLPGKGKSTRSGCRQLQLLNLARSAVPAAVAPPGLPGVTTKLLIEEQLPAATALLTERNGDKNRRNDVPVVTVTVGGNDAFGTILTACLGPDPSGCLGAIQSVFTTFGQNYAYILGELREAGGPTTRIITMTYYNPVPYCAIGQANSAAGPFVDWVLEGGTLPGVGTLPVGYNDLIENISAKFEATPAETFGILGAGDFVGGADCLHPNLSGHTKIAAAFHDVFVG
jgi:lysophospholipase L1-like esterase